jgi:tetratricopeptide (TPR) repeat protein
MIKDLHEGDPENLVYKQRVVSVLHSVSLLFEEKNDTERSVLATQSIIDESRYMQYVKGEAWGFLWLAELQLVKKDYVKAEEARRDALRLADENNLFDVRDEALIVQGKILIAKGRTDEALTCFSEACIASLEHKMDIHIAIVNKVVSFLKRLAYEGNKEVACQIGKHLVESWKKKQLDQKTPQFIKYIEEQMGKLQS